MKTKQTVRVHRGIAYFSSHDCALQIIISNHIAIEFPEVRIVNYEHGYAIQTCKSGDYLGPDLRPSMETVRS